MLSMLAENVSLEFTGGNHIEVVAFLLAQCVQSEMVFDDPKLMLWRLCDAAGLQLQSVSPAKLDRLHELASNDDDRLDNLTEWLRDNTRTISDFQADEHVRIPEKPNVPEDDD